MIGDCGEALGSEKVGWGLVCIGLDGSLTPIALRDGAVVGGPGADTHAVVLPDKSLSARHAQFVVRTDGVYIFDLGHEPGTRVDGVSVRVMGLTDGSVLRMGDTLALFAERELHRYAGKPTILGGEMVVGPRQREWVDQAISHIDEGQSLLIEGERGVGKATLARTAIRESKTKLHVHHFDGADVVRAIRAQQGALLVGTVDGAWKDAQAESRIGVFLKTLVEGRTIRVPCLEQRREDIPALSIQLLGRMGIKLGDGAQGVWEAVTRAGWPGGVRELGAHLAAAFDAAGGEAEQAAKILCRTVPRGSPKVNVSLQDSDEDLARARLKRALERASGAVAGAARELKMSRQAIYRELRRLDLDSRKRDRASPSRH